MICESIHLRWQHQLSRDRGHFCEGRRRGKVQQVETKEVWFAEPVKFLKLWFGTCFIFPYIGNSNPNWRTPSFFRGVEKTTNQWSMIIQSDLFVLHDGCSLHMSRTKALWRTSTTCWTLGRSQTSFLQRRRGTLWHVVWAGLGVFSTWNHIWNYIDHRNTLNIYNIC